MHALEAASVEAADIIKVLTREKLEDTARNLA